MGTGASVDGQPSSPYTRMCAEEIKRAKNGHYVDGEASDFYFLCLNGKIDQIREIFTREDRQHIDELVKLERNGDTALHAAAREGHCEVVKLLLEHPCSRTIRDRNGTFPYDVADKEDIRKLFDRPDGSNHFHETDSNGTTVRYLPKDEKKQDKDEVEILEYFQRFQSEEEIYEYSLNFQTTAMWLKFFNWFSRTFPRLLKRDFLQPDSFDLIKNGDFHHFLKSITGGRYEQTVKEFDEAHRKNSIAPFLKIYSSERLSFYRHLNKQLADSPNEPDTSPHLCDRFIIEFHIRSEELEKRRHLGCVYRGGTLNSSEISSYEKVFEHKPRGVIAFRAFTSTSEDPNMALSFTSFDKLKTEQTNVLFIFQINHKTPTIINIANISEHPHEKEVLILPGNLFIIKNIKKDVSRIYEKKIYNKKTKTTEILETKTLIVTEIYLEYLHIPVSFRKKFMHTIHSTRKDAVTDYN